ncbi:hypothetical protein C8A01DRAFT_16594, partial [Parachaetomium inaequale]
SYQHTILATTAEEPDQERPVRVTLYHWCPPTVPAIATVVVSTGALSAIKGFTTLGSVFLPDDLPAAAAPLDQARDPGPGHQLLADLVTHLAFLPGRGGTCRQFFFSFPVLSNTPDLAFSDSNLRPAWKWVKPDSNYRKKGFWEAELRDALEKGERMSGKDLVILVGGVSEETLRTIASSELGWQFSGLEQAELISRRGGYV